MAFWFIEYSFSNTAQKTISFNHLHDISLFDGFGGAKRSHIQSYFLVHSFSENQRITGKCFQGYDLSASWPWPELPRFFFLPAQSPWPSPMQNLTSMILVKSLLTSNSIPPAPLRPTAYFYVSLTVTLMLSFFLFTGFNCSWQI